MCTEDGIVQNATDEVEAASTCLEIDNRGSKSLSSSLHTEFLHSGSFTRLSELDKLLSCTFPILTNRTMALRRREKVTSLPSTTVILGLPHAARLQDLRTTQQNGRKVLLPSSTDVEMNISMDKTFSVALKPGPRPPKPKPRPRPIGQPSPRRPSPIGRHLNYVDQTDEKFTVSSAPYSNPTIPSPKPNPRPKPKPVPRPCRPEEHLTDPCWRCRTLQ